jgi:diguanylate cyclase (GGDEF)-like protein
MLHARVRAWLARNITSPRERTAIGGEPKDVAKEDYVAALAQFPLFRGLSTELLAHLIDGAFDHAFPPGHVIIGEGEADDRVFVVLSGRVRIVESMPEAFTEAVLGGLGAGEVFGELSALTERPRSATVIATERTHCLAIRHENFLDAVATSPELSLRLLRLLARRLQDSDRRLARYAPDTLTGLASRRAFHDQYRRLAAGARRRKTGVLLLFFDVCALRSANDRFGYKTGDEVLRTVADALIETTRAMDLVARYGGDEFAVLLVDAGPTEVDRVVPRVGEKLKELARNRNLSAPIQCRVGSAFRPEPPETVDVLLREADDDMRAGARRLP